MKLALRRCSAALSLCFFATVALSTAATAADDYPSRAIRMLVPSAVGTGADILARAYAEEAGKKLGQPMIVDNRAGGGGIVATRSMLGAAPDGYTLMVHGPSMITNMLTTPDAGYRIEDMVVLAPVGQISYSIAVANSMPVKTIPELVAYLKANPGKVNYGSTGNTSLGALSTERFLALTGTKAQEIGYKDATAALLDLTTDRIQLFLQTTPLVAPQAKAGKVRLLAVTSEKRSSLLPDIPTVHELGMPSMFVTVWLSMFGQKNLPEAIVAKLRSALHETNNEPAFLARQQSGGFEPLQKYGEDLEAYLRQEVAMWSADIKRSRSTAAQ